MTENTASDASESLRQGPASQAPDEETLALAEKLFQAAREGDTGLLRAYLEAGAPASMTNAAGDSLLMLAAYHGHAGTVELILQHGAEADTANDRGQTPLAGAAFKGYTDVAKLLLEAGADPDAGTPSARDAAKMFARTDILDLLGA
ncbi:ankyrin repeat domain-containing protein [Pseudarthrobacter sulfonivorans]|jgi:ankyrin repeat protein|uniref:ankyrin repeat domain-containing protein n=1 Tax=Pseudarthrobacter sulfonivorans TaxID=121292 RepID=UPI00278682E7|nr:ankyrin repeat domain-containing protein [Pseudarthrobacter sulfonivorans]MDP9997842.1 ankyrin repeat protein [Pseudarthrobacter sulfonivorans]